VKSQLQHQLQYPTICWPLPLPSARCRGTHCSGDRAGAGRRLWPWQRLPAKSGAVSRAVWRAQQRQQRQERMSAVAAAAPRAVLCFAFAAIFIGPVPPAATICNVPGLPGHKAGRKLAQPAGARRRKSAAAGSRPGPPPSSQLCALLRPPRSARAGPRAINATMHQLSSLPALATALCFEVSLARLGGPGSCLGSRAYTPLPAAPSWHSVSCSRWWASMRTPSASGR
jgi:hypothetical protein